MTSVRAAMIFASHALDLFDKLITPILNYGNEVWGFHKAPVIESVHLHLRTEQPTKCLYHISYGG